MLKNASQNVCQCRDTRGQRSAVLAPQISFYVTYDLYYDIVRLRLSRAILPHLEVMSNYWKVKRYF